MAYAEVEPFGEFVADLRHGILSSVVANTNRDPKARPSPYVAEDFIYWHPKNFEENLKSDAKNIDPEQHSELIKQTIFKGSKNFG